MRLFAGVSRVRSYKFRDDLVCFDEVMGVLIVIIQVFLTGQKFPNTDGYF